MATGSLPAKTNGVAHDQESQAILEYRKIVKLRDDIFADTHPRIKIPLQSQKQDKFRVLDSSPSMPSIRVQNGVPKPPQTTHPSNLHSKDLNIPANQTTSVPHKSLQSQRVSAPMPGSSGIDPIFLTVPDVVVKAELQQKRRRIERLLEEQSNKKKVISQQKFQNQDALPDFDITDVLKKARELVKPFKPVESNRANRTASSSDSFDENTFYSSQMNESTTEEADESAKSRPPKTCRFFLDGKCRNGDSCAFSHDSAAKEKLQAVDPPMMVPDNVNADGQANPQRKSTPDAHSSSKDRIPSPASQLHRIAELEEQLRNLKSQSGKTLHDTANGNQRDSRNTYDEPAYSPPDVGDHVVVQHSDKAANHTTETRHITEPGERRTSSYMQKVDREYARRNHSPPSNEVRVIRNHITSPVAPQPARVSPLAVTKVPHIQQGSRALAENPRRQQLSDGDVSARQSPTVFTQRPSSRKRKRVVDSYDRARNVLPRQDPGSPQVRVKEEPVSPPPFSERADAWQPRQRQDTSRPAYIDHENARYRDREAAIFDPRFVEQTSQGYVTTDRRPITPIARRVISRNGHQVEVHEEQDLRRVMSARQVRLPRSPLEQFSASQPSSARAASQVYIPQSAVVPSRLPRASVQPQPLSHVERDRSTSPLSRARFSPARGSVAMAPPGRVVVDQYGHRYLETPSATDRQASVIPIGRQHEFTPRYEQPTSWHPNVRDPHVVNIYDEGQYIRRGASPLSPHYVEYQSAPTYRQVLDRENGHVYNEEVYVPRNENIRMVEHPGPRPAGHYEEIILPRDGMMRTQSVRPSTGQQDIPRERVARIQSVRPEQDRIISLERRREVVPEVNRHVNVRDDEGFLRPTNYAAVERPKHQYAIESQGRRYVEDGYPDDGIAYEPPGSFRRRPL